MTFEHRSEKRERKQCEREREREREHIYGLQRGSSSSTERENMKSTHARTHSYMPRMVTNLHTYIVGAVKQDRMSIKQWTSYIRMSKF